MRRLFLFWRRGGRDLGLLWRALRHPGRPAWLIPAAVLLGFYALEPANFALPLLGVMDDLVLLPWLLRWIVSALPAGVRPRRCARASGPQTPGSSRPRSPRWPP